MWSCIRETIGGRDSPSSESLPLIDFSAILPPLPIAFPHTVILTIFCCIFRATNLECDVDAAQTLISVVKVQKHQGRLKGRQGRQHGQLQQRCVLIYSYHGFCYTLICSMNSYVKSFSLVQIMVSVWMHLELQRKSKSRRKKWRWQESYIVIVVTEEVISGCPRKCFFDII